MNTKTFKKSWRLLNIMVAIFMVLPLNVVSLLIPLPAAATHLPAGICDANVDVVLIMDQSGSMDVGGSRSKCEWWDQWLYVWVKHTDREKTQQWCDAKDQPDPHGSVYTPAVPNKLTAAKNAADTFLGLLGVNDQSGLVSFANTATLNKGFSNDHSGTQAAVNALSAGGATNIGGAIDLSNQELGSDRANPQAVKAAILLTDGRANKPNGSGSGENTADVNYAKAKADVAATLGYKIFTIGLGSDVNTTMLEYIANTTGGNYYFAPDQSDLQGIYDSISQRFCDFGSISGCKYSDSDNDGSIAGDGTLVDWPIILSGDASASQTTDASGCFQFSGLLPGNYMVSEGSEPNSQSYLQTYPASGSYSINLAEGQNVVDKDFGNYLPICGNGILDQNYNEICEIGNTQSCEAGVYIGEQTCNRDCLGWSDCVAQENCGDGIRNGNERCDGHDGGVEGIPDNNICTTSCTLEYVPYCGDGIKNGNEECDGDDDRSCTLGSYSGLETCGQECLWSNCVTNEYCGDGTRNGNEICDNGSNNGTYGSCNSECTGPTPSICGNYVTEGDEECDEGQNGSETCTDDCQTIVTTPNPITIKAYKVICESEEDLPNWATTDDNQPNKPAVITETTAADYIDDSDGHCHWAEEDWDFQWGPPNAQKMDGNFIGPAPAWNNFTSSTGLNGIPAEVVLTNLEDLRQIWVRENLQEGYIPFANDLQDSVSAEILCNDDILNYDNYEWIQNLEPGQTYYCVAFNALVPQEPLICDPDAELVINNSFENPVVTDQANWDIFDSVQTNWITEWMPTVLAQYSGYNRPDQAYLELNKGYLGWLAADESQFAELDGDWFGPGSKQNGEPASVKIYQDIPTMPGYEYSVSFSFSPRPGTNADNNILEFSWDDVVVATSTADGSSNTDTAWQDSSYTLTTTGNTTRLQFADIGTADSLGTFLDNVSVKCIGPTPAPEPEVTVCKQDTEQNYLSGWEVALASTQSDTGTTQINVSDGLGTDSAVLPAGYYLIKVSGTYRYGDEQMIADAGYSLRPINIIDGCDCWKSGFDLSSESNGLMAWVNGNPVYWGPFNDNHVYTAIYHHQSEGVINLSIWDNYYGDNLNNKNFQFEIFQIDYQGITGGNGCVSFEDVSLGSYILDEENRQEWQNISGLGEVGVSENGETFNIVNEEITGPASSICGYKWHDTNENSMKDGDEAGLADWTINLVQFNECSQGDEWADSVVDYVHGTKANGTQLPLERMDSSEALGSAANNLIDEQNNILNFVSLGFGGSLILEFDNIIVNANGNGPDIEVMETSYDSPLCGSYPEKVKVFASQDRIDWIELDGIGCLDSTFDLGPLPWAKYIKLEDASDKDTFYPDGDGFDVDGVRALHCASSQELIDSETTNGNGNYCFENLDPGEYRVEEEMQTGWTNVTPIYQDISIQEGQSIGVNFGNTYEITPEEGNICGYKFYDEDRDGLFDEGENGIEDWTIAGYTGDGSPITTDTDETGRYCLTGLEPGTWTVYEELLPGWQNTAPTSTSVVLAQGQGVDNINFYNYLTYCGDGIIQQPNGQGAGGRNYDGFEECDGQTGVTQGYYCSEICTLELTPETCEADEQATCNIAEQVGLCAQGIKICQENGSWGDCTAVYQPTSEICDELDNDCDGVINNGITCGEDNPGGGGGGGGGNVMGLIIHTQQALGNTSFSAVITWFTNRLATTRVVYDTVSHILPGTPSNYGYQWSTPTSNTDPKVSFHLVTINGLLPGTTYYFLPISAASPETLGEEISLTIPSDVEEPLNPEIPPEENNPEEEPINPPGTVAGSEYSENGFNASDYHGQGIVAGVKYEEELLALGDETEEPDIIKEIQPTEENQEPKQTESQNSGSNFYYWLALIIFLILLALLLLFAYDKKMKKDNKNNPEKNN